MMKKYALALLAFSLILVQVLSAAATDVCVDNPVYVDKIQEKTEEDFEFVEVTFESNNFSIYGEIYYPANATGTYPGIVFCEGLAGYVSAYSWIAQALAKQGYVVLIFDFPGQGKSEGLLGNFTFSLPKLNFYLRFSAFIETGYHYIFGKWAETTSDALTYLLEASPKKDLIDETKIGLMGHSLGGLTVTEAAAMDKRFDAVVALSQGNFIATQMIDVPIQFQAGMFDRATYSVEMSLFSYFNANAPKEIVFISAGTHIGFTSAFGKFCLCPPWQKELCIRYALGWFDYYLKNSLDAYTTITTGADHLSKILRSRYDFGEGNKFLE